MSSCEMSHPGGPLNMALGTMYETSRISIVSCLSRPFLDALAPQ